MYSHVVFSEFKPEEEKIFDKLLKIFLELMVVTSGDLEEVIAWMKEIDQKYNITGNDYSIDQFVDDLKAKGYLREYPGSSQPLKPSAKTEKLFRSKALEEIFGKIKKSSTGNHNTSKSGKSDDISGDLKKFEFGDLPENIDYTESFKNALINSGVDNFSLTENDLAIRDTEQKSSTATVLLIDISHSMILYGEDRITPAKKVAMALAELIKIKYPKDSLDIVAFGNDAFKIEIKDLPYLSVGPFHTNTIAGLQMAIDILHKKKTPNKQIFMITDGKPTCMIENGSYYKNSFGLDDKIINKTLNLAAQCRKLKIPVTTFMIASDPYLKQFVEDFTEINGGKAFYSGLDNLGSFIFDDFTKGKKKLF
jgi:uncharacterized protein with von Willebrand factor type A (vWA) domain